MTIMMAGVGGCGGPFYLNSGVVHKSVSGWNCDKGCLFCDRLLCSFRQNCCLCLVCSISMLPLPLLLNVFVCCHILI